ncbi:tyrosine--tRNA ligase, partial [Klebsiella oxytoca]
QDGMPTIELEKGNDLQHALVNAELVPSRGQARTMIGSNAVSINGEKQDNPEYVFEEKDFLFGHYSILRRGKKHYCLVIWK